MDVCELDTDNHLFVGEAVEVVAQLTVVVTKVHIELCLEEKFCGVYIVHAKESGVKTSICYQAEDTSYFHGYKLSLRLGVCVEESSDTHCESC